MSKSNTYENDLMLFTFNATAIGGIGGNLFVSLHSADVGEAGDQTTSEILYTGYARVSIARDTTGWTVVINNAINAVQILFGNCTAGTATASHWAIGTSLTGAGKVLYKGALNSSLAISLNIQPIIGAGALSISED
jgi:hypothetical protein